MSKKGMLRKFLSVLVAVLMIASSFPISTAYAATSELEDCPDCSTTGVIDCPDCTDGLSAEDCDVCGGTKSIDCPDCTDGLSAEDCDTCGGTGLVEENPCDDCNSTGKKACSTCNGTEQVDCTDCNSTGKKTCVTCAGSKDIECESCNGTGKIAVEYEICPDCNGDKDCQTCNGVGTVKVPCTNTDCNDGQVEVACTNSDCVSGKVEVDCSTCNGSALVQKTTTETCPTCSGAGVLVDDLDCPDCENGEVSVTNDVDCDDCASGKVKVNCSICNGTAKVKATCPTCNGTKKVDATCSDCVGSKKCANCNGKGKIKTLADNTFAFETVTPENIKVGDTFVNVAASTSNTTGAVTYDVDDSNVASVDVDGKLTAKKAGTVIVTAKIATDYSFSSAEVSYSITIDKATPVITNATASAITFGQKLSASTISATAKVGTTEIAGTFAWADSSKNVEPTVVTDSDNTEYDAVFTPNDTDNYTAATFTSKVTVNKADITGVTATGYTGTYDKNSHEAVTVSGTEAGDTVEYSTDNVSYSTQVPSVKNVEDSKTIYVRVTRDDNYNQYTTTATTSISPAKIDGVTFDVYSGTYDGTAHDAVVLSGEGYKSDDTVTYIYNGQETSELKFKDAGEYDVKVKINRTDSNYKETNFPDETDATFKVVISKKDATVTANDVTKVYNGEAQSSVNTEATISGNVTGHIFTTNVIGTGKNVGTYTLTPSNIKIFDTESNDVTSNYNITPANGTLEITQKPITITANDVDVTYNAKPYGENGYVQTGLIAGQEISALTISGENTAVGTYTDALVPSAAVIKADEEDVTSNYVITYNKGNMTISYLTIEDVNDTYAVNDANEFGWYNGKVTLTANVGYKLCYANTNYADFVDSLEYTTEGKTQPSISVMDTATGFITDILTCNEVKIDTVKPDVFDITYKTPLAYKVLELVTFGIYNAPTVATIYASDANSNIKSVSYKLTGADYVEVPVADMTFADGKYSYEVTIPASFKGQLQYFATDASGLKSDIKADDNGIIVDVTNPVVTEIDYNTELSRDVNGETKYYYADDATVDFTINEEYFFEAYKDATDNDVAAIDSAVDVFVTKDGNPYTGFEKTLNESAKTISVKILAENNDGDFVVTLTYRDPANNAVTVTTNKLVIDTTSPVVTVGYKENNASNEKYFNANRTMVVTIVEHNFFSENIATKFTAEDINENPVTVEDFAETIKNNDNWNHSEDGNTHTIELPFTVDANYTYKFEGYKDASNNDCEYSFAEGTVAANEFVIDHIKPTNVVIDYIDSVLDKVLSTVTFGFYEGNCEVTLTTTDATSPIDYFSYSYDVTDPVNTANVGGAEEKAIPVVDSTDKSKFTTKFEIEPQYRGFVTATATDMASNESLPVTGDYSIVTDTTPPEISVSYSKEDNHRESNGVDYYNDDVTVTLNVTDENFLDGEYPDEVRDMVITAKIIDENGNESTENYEVNNWTRVNGTDEWQGTFVLSTEGDYTLSIDYAVKADNKSTNKMETYTRDKLTIDKTAPVITAEYNTPIQTISKEGKEVAYYNSDVGLKLTVVEHNFNAADFVSKICATDVNGNIMTDVNEAIQKYLSKVENDDDFIGNWTKNGNTYTIDVPLEDAEANYVIDYSYDDLAKNSAEAPTPKNVTYDVTNPTVELSIKATVVRKILNGITFGIFDKNVDANVTITATDKTSGIEKIEYSTNVDPKVEGSIGKIENNTLEIENIVVPNNVESAENVTIAKENGQQIVSYTFKVNPEFRNKIIATAYDYSTNSASVDNIKNKEDDSTYNGIIKDNSAPKLKLTVDEAEAYASKDTFADNFNFYVELSDVNAGIAKIEANINGEEVLVDNTGATISNIYASDETKDALIETASFAINTSQVEVADDGVYVLTVKITDNAGNVTEKSYEAYYEAYIDVWAPMITDFSFESSGKAYTGDDAYIYGEKVGVVDKDTNTYDYYFEKTTKVTVYAYDLEASNVDFSQHTAGIKEISLIAENRNGEPVVCKPVEGSFIQTANNKIGYSEMTFIIEGPFKGNLYAMATDYAGNFPTEDQTNGHVESNYSNLISDKYDGYVNPYDTILESIDKHKSTSIIEIVPKTKTEKTQTYAYKYQYAGDAQIRDKKIAFNNSNKVPLYKSDVKFDLTVEDSYSGIKQVRWSVVGQNDQDVKNNQSGVLTINNIGKKVNGSDSGWKTTKESDSNLVTLAKKTITVNNNSNDIVILVELTDRAGNTSYDYYILGIDKTAAKVTVELDKNASNGKYFNQSRTATITVVERNFDSKSFDLTINKNEDDSPSVNGANLKWKNSDKDINATNATTHIATYTISPEGDYKIEASNIDIAGNETNNKTKTAPQYKGVAPTNFVIDKKQPEIAISMTGTSKNEKFYFNEDRTVTIVVTDRNFNPRDALLRITANGSAYSPKLSWKQDQNGPGRTNATTNTATFTISSEADYTFDFSCVDKANNSSKQAKYATDDCQRFTIDKTAPTVAISQMVYRSANNGRDENGNEIKIPLTVTVKDTNIGNLYSNNAVTAKEVNERLNVSKLTGNESYSAFAQSNVSRNTVVYASSNVEGDGIYTLNLNIQDCAGNKMNSITYNSSKDKTSTQSVSNGTSNFFTFSINRNGSAYGIDDNTSKLVKTYYVQNVTNDVKIIETNVDKLDGEDLRKNVKVVKDGEVDESVIDFIKVTNMETSSAWQRYTYTIDKMYFDPEATYEISIQSKDSANNSGYSDLKLEENSLKFVVDRTVPVVSIVGITSDTSYFKDSQDVSVTISDDVILSKIKILINNNVELELVAKEFGDYFVDGKFVWNHTVPNDDGTNEIKVVCYDAAGNTNIINDNNDTEEVDEKSIVENFLVTTDRGEIAKFWIINHVVQTAIIGVATAAIVASVTWFILYRRRLRLTPDEE